MKLPVLTYSKPATCTRDYEAEIELLTAERDVAVMQLNEWNECYISANNELVKAKAALVHANAMNRFEEGTRNSLMRQVEYQFDEITKLKDELASYKLTVDTKEPQG